jgi:hypothetical protein
LGRNHLHDFTLAETPTAAKFPAGNGALLYKFIDGSRMDLQQAGDLGRGENFLPSAHFLQMFSGANPDLLNRRQCRRQISDSASKEKTLMPKTSENF